ncbi:DHS-like NAD/FAD-binding domain-containing protein [Leptodontidium sp. 2 PMI_412]|nr:DHS-like NAD/FAD-binding domain-containing protein [Leptodontidium sp. 2 PMI_412]
MAAVPTPFHHVLAMLAENGKLRRLWTYNIDEVDTRFEFLSSNLMSNSKFPLTIQMHGGLRKTICTKCSLVEELVPAVLMNPDPRAWHCTTCSRANAEPTARGTEQRLQHVVGRKSANIVMYEDPLGNPTLEDNVKFLKKDATAPCVDAVLVVGLSATTPSVQQLVRDLGAKRGRKLFWINKVPPPKIQGFDKIFHTVALTDCQLFATDIMRSTDLDKPCFD